MGLIYLLYSSFDLLSIHKPNSSRPANAERYVICKWKRDRTHTEGILKYLTECHELLWHYSQEKCGAGSSERDILELVPLEVLTRKDSNFYAYIRKSNDM